MPMTQLVPRPQTAWIIGLALLLWLPTSTDRADAQTEQTRQILDLAMQPPQINTDPGPDYGDVARDMSMIIGMDRTPGGRIWAAWVSGGDSELGFFVAATSDDGGQNSDRT